LANECGVDAALVGCWLMEEGSGSTLFDSSGHGNHGTISGNPMWLTGVSGFGLQLDGVDDYVLVPDNASLDIDSQMTIAAWVKTEKLGTQNILKKSFNDTINGYELSLANNPSSQPPSGDGRAFGRFNQDTSGNSYRINSVTPYANDGSTWVHLALTNDGTTMRIYYNGVEEATLATTTLIATNNLPLSIGAQSNGGFALDGELDSVRLYNRALSVSEVELLAGISIVALNGSLTLQGRTDHASAATVVLYPVGGNTPLAIFAPVVNSDGSFSISGVAPDTYQVAVKHAKYLQQVQTLTLNAGTNSASFGELLGGDANNDNVADFLDFSVLVSTFDLAQGNAGYDVRADFNGDNQVDFLDFSILVSNFDTIGEEPVATP
jgi:hypothetical protein